MNGYVPWKQTCSYMPEIDLGTEICSRSLMLEEACGNSLGLGHAHDDDIKPYKVSLH